MLQHVVGRGRRWTLDTDFLVQLKNLLSRSRLPNLVGVGVSDDGLMYAGTRVESRDWWVTSRPAMILFFRFRSTTFFFRNSSPLLSLQCLQTHWAPSHSSKSFYHPVTPVCSPFLSIRCSIVTHFTTSVPSLPITNRNDDCRLPPPAKFEWAVLLLSELIIKVSLSSHIVIKQKHKCYRSVTHIKKIGDVCFLVFE